MGLIFHVPFQNSKLETADSGVPLPSPPFGPLGDNGKWNEIRLHGD